MAGPGQSCLIHHGLYDAVSGPIRTQSSIFKGSLVCPSREPLKLFTTLNKEYPFHKRFRAEPFQTVGVIIHPKNPLLTTFLNPNLKDCSQSQFVPEL